MSESRPFRFGVINERMTSRAAWIDRAKRAEDLGYSTFLIRDHFVPDYFGDQFAPFTALMAAAMATTTLRVGTLVIDNDYRHPVILAKEAATLDLFADGRFELGLGAGWLETEYEQAGLPFDAPGVRIDRMEESIAVLQGLFGDNPVTHHGTHYRIEGLHGFPKPMQRPYPPLLIGGGGNRILKLAGRVANIVHFLPRQINTGTLISDPADRLADQIALKIDRVREGAGERFNEIELGLGVIIAVGANRGHVAEQVVQAMGWNVPADAVWQMPSVLAGSVEEIADDLIVWRERLGLSYFTVDDANMDELAPIVARLAGR